jgi:basic membrane lipoprotein Med (substrate-binding protein (PBP1-ABC) superfamily)
MKRLTVLFLFLMFAATSASAQSFSFVNSSSSGPEDQSYNDSSGTGLMAARQALGTALHQLTYGGATLSPPANLQAIVQ